MHSPCGLRESIAQSGSTLSARTVVPCSVALPWEARLSRLALSSCPLSVAFFGGCLSRLFSSFPSSFWGSEVRCGSAGLPAAYARLPGMCRPTCGVREGPPQA
ncbi:unnamed protein product [Prorocentrum cordatum]|uniref:Uncharacterized protein n=1 Tax=Prorocentrum cordatum TaxID=2364126 RepID=A0ABN9Q3J0_9DINO|nr:unnamed protein product [Polarella glacialis]